MITYTCTMFFSERGTFIHFSLHFSKGITYVYYNVVSTYLESWESGDKNFFCKSHQDMPFFPKYYEILPIYQIYFTFEKVDFAIQRSVKICGRDGKQGRPSPECFRRSFSRSTLVMVYTICMGKSTIIFRTFTTVPNLKTC